jgi:trichoplein keratin filament-binding protein
MLAYTRQQEESDERKQERLTWLRDRQSKLKELLRNESLVTEVELKKLRTNGRDNSNTLDAMKSRAENLKSAREEDRKKLAEQKLYENWRINNPEIREIESKKHQDFVVEKWKEQQKEKQDLIQMLNEQDNEYVKYLELERQKQQDLDLELQRLKLNREIELKEILKQQMIELKQREYETEVINREEADLMNENLQIMKLQEEREKMTNLESKQEYGRQLLRQHKAKLRKRAKEVQEELELDLKILKLINDTQDKQRHVESAKRLKAKADAEKMLMVLHEQLRLEKQREAELESMFQDEAAKEWEKRNAQWERESQARQALMKQVLEERQNQINEKFDLLNEKKVESLRKREELLKDMEQTQLLAMREREKLEQAKIERRQDFESQLTTRKETLFEQDILENVDNYEQDQIKKESYEKFLHEEKKKANDAKFEPKVKNIYLLYFSHNILISLFYFFSHLVEKKLHGIKNERTKIKIEKMINSKIIKKISHHFICFK